MHSKTAFHWFRQTYTPAVASLALALLVSGCLGSEEDVDAAAVSEALELENGGLDMSDEAPMFGDVGSFDERELAERAAEVRDDLAEESEVRGMREAQDAVHYRLAIHWGQIPGNPNNDTPRDWSGVFQINRGAMLVRRTIAFDRGDALLPRRDRTQVPFVSWTLPHRDGLIVEVIDPTPAADEPLVLSYIADLPGRVEIATLLDGRVEVVVDDANNRMVAAAMARPVDLCEHGFLMGHWRRVSPRDEPARGRFIGRVVSAEGEPQGHVRGVYGERRNGNQVFFGKYINRDGAFRGILRGSYGDGSFEGRWLTRAGEAGSVAGRYAESSPGPRPAGHFIGRWQEHTCTQR